MAEQIRHEAWGDGGEVKSPAHWLNYRCGITIGAAREKVRVAKSLAALPLIDNAFKSGALSYSKVRAMVRVATPENESFLLQIARYGTASHMEKLVRKYQWVDRLNSDDQAQTQQDERCFSWYYDGDGMVIFHGKLPAESGTVVVKALQAAYDAIHNKLTGPMKLLDSLPVVFPPMEREAARQADHEEWSVADQYSTHGSGEHAKYPEEVVQEEVALTPAAEVTETIPRSCEEHLDPEMASEAGQESSNSKDDSADTFDG